MSTITNIPVASTKICLPVPPHDGQAMPGVSSSSTALQVAHLITGLLYRAVVNEDVNYEVLTMATFFLIQSIYGKTRSENL